MSAEPLFCTLCGAEDFDCECPDGRGPYCHFCGVEGCDETCLAETRSPRRTDEPEGREHG